MNKEQKKRKMNVIDWIAIIIVILCIAAAVYFFTRGSSNTSFEKNYIDFKIELLTVKNRYVGFVKIDDPVIGTVHHSDFGRVIDVKYEDAAIATTDMLDGGIMAINKYPDHKKVTITIRAEYKISDTGEYTISGTALAVGAFLDFSTPHFITSGYCISVEKVDNQTAKEWQKQLDDSGKRPILSENGGNK